MIEQWCVSVAALHLARRSAGAELDEEHHQIGVERIRAGQHGGACARGRWIVRYMSRRELRLSHRIAHSLRIAVPVSQETLGDWHDAASI